MKIIVALRKSTAAAVAAALVGVAPGIEPYRAAAGPIVSIVTPGQAGGVPVPVVRTGGSRVLAMQGGALSAGTGLRGGRVGEQVRPLTLPSPIGRGIQVPRGAGGGGDAGGRGTRAGGVALTFGPSPKGRGREGGGGDAGSAVLDAGPQADSELADAAPRTGALAEAVLELVAETPDFGRMAEDGAAAAAETDFFRKVGQGFRSRGETGVRGVGSGVRGWFRGALAGAASNGVSKNFNTRKGGKMPDQPGPNENEITGPDRGGRGVPDPDGTLNPRHPDDGPDTVSDEFGGRGGRWGSVLFSALGLTLAPAAAYASGMSGMLIPTLVAGGIAWFGILVPAAVLHEYSRGLVAHILGDDSARNAGRLSLNPFKHIDLKRTVLMPLALAVFGLPPVGAAKPVPVDAANFKRPVLGLALTAASGPLVNIGLALAGVATFNGLTTAASPWAVPATLAAVVAIRLNLVLAFWNLVPMPGSDGWNILRAAVGARVRADMDSFQAGLSGTMRRSRLARWSLYAIGLAVSYALLVRIDALTGVAMHWMLGLEGVPAIEPAPRTLSASAAPPLALSLSLLSMGGPLTAARVIEIPGAPTTATPPPAKSPELGRAEAGAPAGAESGRVKLMVRIPQPVRWKSDYHVDWVDFSRPDWFIRYETSVQAMGAQLEQAGIPAALLREHDAAPLATYATLVRAATLSVPIGRKAELEAALRGRGFVVEDPRSYRIPELMPAEDRGPAARTVTLQEVVKITGADKVQEILKQELDAALDPARLRVPEFLKPLTLKLMRRLGMLQTPLNPAGSVIDTGDDPDHPMLKGRMARSARDGHGHGTWVASAVTSFDPAQKNLRSYNTFKNGSGTTDDILRDYTLAHKEGAEWFTNSWGDSWGDPDALEAQMVRKVAETGKVQFFAAGNQGDADNTVGGPAIAYYKDPKTGTMTIVSVGATDADGATAWFQSRGPWSPYFNQNPGRQPGYPNRVDIQSVGHKVYGAYPTYMRGADRVDPELGPQKESSGTSMSTPTLGGAYSLLREFGFAPVAILKSLLDTARNTGKPEKEAGRGFVDVYAAYQALKRAQESGLRGLLRPAASRLAKALTR